MRTVLVTALLALGLAGCQPAPIAAQPAAAAPRAKPSEVGRFVIVHSPEVERDTILLDTMTGKTWTRVEVNDLTNDPPAWDPMPQLNGDADFDALRVSHPPKSHSK